MRALTGPDTRRTAPPAVVQAAALVTWIAATGTALLTLLLTAGFLLVAGPLFATFDEGSGNPRWGLLGAAAAVVGLSAAADVAGVLMVRGRGWARWLLVALSVVAALGGLLAAYYVLPLAVTAAAVTVVVLLHRPAARAWFREASRPRRGTD